MASVARVPASLYPLSFSTSCRYTRGRPVTGDGGQAVPEASEPGWVRGGSPELDNTVAGGSLELEKMAAGGGWREAAAGARVHRAPMIPSTCDEAVGGG